MATGYLLDTNILSYWFDSESRFHQRVVERVELLDPSDQLFLSAISLGEIEYGRLVAPPGNADLQAIRTFVETRLPPALEVGQSTAECYGLLRQRLFDRYAPGRNRKRTRPEQLFEPSTAVSLGIQENDLWIASTASEHNLVLVTNDKMEHLKAVAGDLLQFAFWVA